MRYAIRANVLMSYELAMGFYRRSFYERYQPNDVYMYAYIYIHDVTAADVSRTHRRNGQHSNDEAISRCSISVLSHGKNLYSLFTSILGSTHFPRVIASLFYELLNGACWITSRRGRISRSSNKIIRLSRNYTSLSLSLVQFFVCPCFRSFQNVSTNARSISPFLPLFYFVHVLFFQRFIPSSFHRNSLCCLLR